MADTVLIVDDDKAVQTMLYKVIRSNGLLADTASGGTDALRLATERHYDLILMDIRMPVLDGIEATRQIREMDGKGGSDVPIVALTASAYEGDARRGREAGRGVGRGAFRRPRI